MTKMLRYGLPNGSDPVEYHNNLDKILTKIINKELDQESKYFIKLSTTLSKEQLDRQMTI